MWHWLEQILGRVGTEQSLPQPMPPKIMEPRWLEIARKEIGVHETRGGETKRILEYHAQTSLHASDDETSWCSSFMNWCMMSVGLRGTRSAAARSWESWGLPLDKPIVGCIVVFWRGSKDSGLGHVAFYMGEQDRDYILCLGGNQGDKVCIAPEPKARVIAYRWPKIT